MDTRPEDLADFERRLAGLLPAEDGLSSDAAVYAAGLAAGRRGRGRGAWPLVAAGLAVLAGTLGWQLAVERHVRNALAAELALAKKTTPPLQHVEPVSDSPPPSDARPDTLLASHRLIESGLGELPVPNDSSTSHDPGSHPRPSLRAWPLRAWPEL